MKEIITSTQNETVKAAKRMKLKKGRVESGLFLVEGEKCVAELMAHRPEDLHTLFVYGDKFESAIKEAADIGARVCRVADIVIDAICDCKTSQGIVAVARMPKHSAATDGFIVALDDVQDPQNVGTIIRTADAAGASCVVLSTGSADPYSPKAVRASMGSLFHIPVVTAQLPQYLESLSPLGYHIAGAHLSGQTEYTLDAQRTCLVIGNETRGISDAVSELTTQFVKIPMFGKAESLNAAVAAGILIYKIRT